MVFTARFGIAMGSAVALASCTSPSETHVSDEDASALFFATEVVAHCEEFEFSTQALDRLKMTKPRGGWTMSPPEAYCEIARKATCDAQAGFETKLAQLLRRKAGESGGGECASGMEARG